MHHKPAQLRRFCLFLRSRKIEKTSFAMSTLRHSHTMEKEVLDKCATLLQLQKELEDLLKDEKLCLEEKYWPEYEIDTRSPQGLTPDWLIKEAAFKVFNLKHPTIQQPYIKGLLDPCTNSKETPNIPAEVLYDKKDDGLDIENAWKGFHVLLNAPFDRADLWRWLNRAVDEVENGHCPAIIAITPNSTDANYFQRFRPYLRCSLRRDSIQFKDYVHKPQRFGITLFCIAMWDQRCYHKKFYDAFSAHGDVSIVLDPIAFQGDFLNNLLVRNKHKTDETLRDQWVQCENCDVFRQVHYSLFREVRANPNKKWTCADLSVYPRSCSAKQTKGEEKMNTNRLYSKEKRVLLPTNKVREGAKQKLRKYTK